MSNVEYLGNIFEKPQSKYSWISHNDEIDSRDNEEELSSSETKISLNSSNPFLKGRNAPLHLFESGKEDIDLQIQQSSSDNTKMKSKAKGVQISKDDLEVKTKSAKKLPYDESTLDQLTRHRASSFRTQARAPRVFGPNYKYMKNYISTSSDSPHAMIDQEVNQDLVVHREEREGIEFSSKYSKLQQALKSSNKKISQLKEINDMSLQRKDELQKEVFAAYKKISILEAETQTKNNKQQELTVEVRIAKQRIAEAEREAANSIGCSSKLERDLIDTDIKRQRFWEELCVAEKKINELEMNLREAQNNFRTEVESKHQFLEKTNNIRLELKTSNEEKKTLKEELEIKQKENKTLMGNFEIVAREKEKCNGQIEELTKSNVMLKDELSKLQSRYHISQRTVEQCNSRLKDQKDRFDAFIASRLNIENELQEIHKDCGKQRIEKESFAAECNKLIETLNESRDSMEKCQEKCESLKNENKQLKDKVLYLDLYKSMIENKTFSAEKSTIKPAKQYSTTPFNERCYLHDHSDNDDVQRKLQEISRQIQAVKQEHKIMHDKADSVTKTCYAKEKENSSGTRSPYDFPVSLNKPSLFHHTYVPTSDKVNITTSNFSDIIQGDNGDIANALL